MDRKKASTSKDDKQDSEQHTSPRMRLGLREYSNVESQSQASGGNKESKPGLPVPPRFGVTTLPDLIALCFWQGGQFRNRTNREMDTHNRLTNTPPHKGTPSAQHQPA